MDLTGNAINMVTSEDITIEVSGVDEVTMQS